MDYRDYQRDRVYTAENVSDVVVDQLAPRVDLTGAQELVDLLAAEFDVDTLPVRFNNRLARGGWYKHFDVDVRGPIIEVIAGPIRVSTLLHEFAHHLHVRRGDRLSDHGGIFTAIHVEVVRAYLGDVVADAMLTSYARHGVDVGEAAESARFDRIAATKPARGTRRMRYGVRVHWRNEYGVINQLWYNPSRNKVSVSSGTRWARPETAERYAAQVVERSNRTQRAEVVEVEEEYWDGWYWYRTGDVIDVFE